MSEPSLRNTACGRRIQAGHNVSTTCVRPAGHAGECSPSEPSLRDTCPHCGEIAAFCSYADEPDPRRRPGGCIGGPEPSLRDTAIEKAWRELDSAGRVVGPAEAATLGVDAALRVIRDHVQYSGYGTSQQIDQHQTTFTLDPSIGGTIHRDPPDNAQEATT